MEKDHKKRACKHCHHLFIPVRNPHQQFCRQRCCQNVRKSSWRREKNKVDPDYDANQKHASKRWRQKNPSYWKQYRASHPRYTDNNRDNQKQRQQMLRKKLCCNESLFANSDALVDENTVKSGTYQLLPVLSAFANSDALIVKISILSKSSPQMGDVCKHTTL